MFKEIEKLFSIEPMGKRIPSDIAHSEIYRINMPGVKYAINPKMQSLIDANSPINSNSKADIDDLRESTHASDAILMAVYFMHINICVNGIDYGK